MTLGLFQKVVLADGFLAPGGREGLRRARGRAGDARRVGRDPRVRRADLLRFRRLFDLGDRGRLVPRLRHARQFPLPLCARSVSPTSGGAGTSPCRAGCATISTFRWAAIATATARTYTALMGTMLLGGLWHGANWTFVVWGGLHGLYLSVERWLQGALRRLDARAARRSSALGAAHLSPGQHHLGVLPRQDLHRRGDHADGHGGHGGQADQPMIALLPMIIAMVIVGGDLRDPLGDARHDAGERVIERTPAWRGRRACWR